MNKDVELILLFGLAILYVLWAAVYLHYEKWKLSLIHISSPRDA